MSRNRTLINRDDYPMTVALLGLLLGHRKDLADDGAWTIERLGMSVDFERCSRHLSSTEVAILSAVRALHRLEGRGGTAPALANGFTAYVSSLMATGGPARGSRSAAAIIPSAGRSPEVRPSAPIGPSARSAGSGADSRSGTRAVALAAGRSTLVEASRQELLTKAEALTVRQLAVFTGSSEAATRRWLRAERGTGRAVAVTQSTRLLVPAFQFGPDQRLLPAASAVIGVLRGVGMSSWAIWDWFYTANTWLGDGLPVEMLRSQPDAVLYAARRVVE